MYYKSPFLKTLNQVAHRLSHLFELKNKFSEDMLENCKYSLFFILSVQLKFLTKFQLHT